ncbi:hypothetical protein Tco_0300426 [Tanacetum coccineum]
MVKSWLVQDQTGLGKDYSNLLIADSLLKTIWFINAPCYGNEALASPKANALVDGKKVIITETSVRRDLQLEDAKGIECLPNADFFEQLALMGYRKPSQKHTFYKAFFSPQWKFLIHTILQCLSAKSTAWNEFSSTMASAIICLATNQKFNFSMFIFESMVKNVDSSVKFLMYPRVGKGFSRAVTPLFPTMMVQAQEEIGEGSAMPTDPHHTPIIQPSTSQPQKKQSKRKLRKDIEIPQSSGPTDPIADEAANEENVPTQSNDPPLSRVNTLGSREDRLKLKELMDLYTKLSNRVLDLETTKTAQAKVIASLKKRVKKLERKRKSKTPGMKRLFKVGRSAQVVSFKDEGLGDQEDASKQGRKIDDIDKDVEVILVNETQGRYDDDQMFDTDVFNGEEVFVVEQSEKFVEEVVSTAEVSAATTITTEEITLAQALAELKSEKPKIMDNVHAMIEADRLLAERLQAREQKELTDEVKARLFVELLEKRKKHFATLRAQEKRNKPPTKAQKKTTMSTYLVNMFVDMDTELVKESSKKAEKEMAQESSSKRAGEELEQEMLRDFDREDLETLWKLVKAKHGFTRLEEGYERVL